jgi:two-component system response regulator RegA
MDSSSRRNVLIVDDDERFVATLARALTRRGWNPICAHNAATALALSDTHRIDAATLDLRLDADDGLALVEPIRRLHPHARLLVLTGYASIATAVRAIKLGADDYLTKPATATAIVQALERGAPAAPGQHEAEPLTTRRLEWEHIQRVLLENNGNVSATARSLRMHRRTLQRKLAKRPDSR